MASVISVAQSHFILFVSGDRFDQASDVEDFGLHCWLQAQLVQGVGGDRPDAGEVDSLHFFFVVGAEEGGEVLRRAAAGEGDPIHPFFLPGLRADGAAAPLSVWFRRWGCRERWRGRIVRVFG